MAKKEFAILRRTFPTLNENGKLTRKTEEFRVKVMARAKGYAMVRRPRCAPFVEPEDSLFSIDSDKQGE